MITKDYHGYPLNDAIDDLNRIIGEVRMSSRTEYAEFITGFGVIRAALHSTLKVHGLDPSYKIGNEGIIVVTIE
ncbi:hypothetical protein LCGC14_1726880 [marine sediment metagenome]|uniref:Uncharacterized protein n=1 Tax=marine sediment metagenome TaxID=412755 RepID=A0A0F9JRC8_9ZZZZ